MSSLFAVLIVAERLTFYCIKGSLLLVHALGWSTVIVFSRRLPFCR